MKIFFILVGSHLFSFVAGCITVYMNREWLAEKASAIANVFKRKQD